MRLYSVLDARCSSTPFRCDEHASEIRGLDGRVAKLETAHGSRWIPVLVSAVGTLGMVSAAATAAYVELQKLKASIPQSAEALRQQALAAALNLVEDRSQESYERGRRDGHAEGRSEALTEALEAAKREGVASKTRRR